MQSQTTRLSSWRDHFSVDSLFKWLGTIFLVPILFVINGNWSIAGMPKVFGSGGEFGMAFYRLLAAPTIEVSGADWPWLLWLLVFFISVSETYLLHVGMDTFRKAKARAKLQTSMRAFVLISFGAGFTIFDFETTRRGLMSQEFAQTWGFWLVAFVTVFATFGAEFFLEFVTKE